MAGVCEEQEAEVDEAVDAVAGVLSNREATLYTFCSDSRGTPVRTAQTTISPRSTVAATRRTALSLIDHPWLTASAPCLTSLTRLVSCSRASSGLSRPLPLSALKTTGSSADCTVLRETMLSSSKESRNDDGEGLILPYEGSVLGAVGIACLCVQRPAVLSKAKCRSEEVMDGSRAEGK